MYNPSNANDCMDFKAQIELTGKYPVKQFLTAAKEVMELLWNSSDGMLPVNALSLTSTVVKNLNCLKVLAMIPVKELWARLTAVRFLVAVKMC